MIHNLEPSIHNLVHTFWQGNGLEWRSLNRDRHSHGPQNTLARFQRRFQLFNGLSSSVARSQPPSYHHTKHLQAAAEEVSCFHPINCPLNTTLTTRKQLERFLSNVRISIPPTTLLSPHQPDEDIPQAAQEISQQRPNFHPTSRPLTTTPTNRGHASSSLRDFSAIFAALVAIINMKLPQVGELV